LQRPLKSCVKRKDQEVDIGLFIKEYIKNNIGSEKIEVKGLSSSNCMMANFNSSLKILTSSNF